MVGAVQTAPHAVTKVFLSYSRADEAAAPFAAPLYQRLTAAGFEVWFDRMSMPSRSLTFLQEIRDAIRACDRLVVILGSTALHSEYVRAEWQAALVEGVPVVPVLRSGTYAELPGELRNLHCPDGSPARLFDDVVAELTRILGEPVPPLARLVGAVPDQPPHFRPRPDVMSELAGALLYDVEHPVVVTGAERVHFLHGMGGSGKSVMAAAFARSSAARRVFVDGVVWLGVSIDQTSLDVTRGLLDVLGQPVLHITSVPAAVSALRSALGGGRTLVVLDNVWALEQVEPVVQAVPPVSRVLVTTRQADLATALGATSQGLDEFGDDAGRQHLADWIGVPVEELPEEAKEVARYCGNLPLALALQGALAREGVPWTDLLDALRTADVGFAEHLLAAYQYRSVLQALEVSITHLERTNATAAARFGELAAFTWVDGVAEPAVVGFWRHTGDVEDRYARRLLAMLEQRALLRLDATASPRRVHLHDLMASVLVARSNRASLNARLLDAYRRQCGRVWAEGPADGYFHAHLVEHLQRAGADDDVDAVLRAEDGLGRNTWFAAQRRHGSSAAYVADVRRAWAHTSSRTRDELTRCGRSTAIGGELRAALMCASVNSVASGLTPLLVPLVASAEGWSTARMLSEARAVAVPERRVETLTAIAPLLAGEEHDRLVSDALSAVRSIADPYWRAGALARLVPVLGLDATDQEVERVVKGISEPNQRVAIEAFLAYLRAGGDLVGLASAPDAADSGFRDPRSLAAELARFNPYAREASLLRHRYVDAPGGGAVSLLEQARAIADRVTRALVLAVLADELAGDEAAAVRTEAVQASQMIKDGRIATVLRADLLACLAARGHGAEACGLAASSGEPIAQAAALLAVIPHLDSASACAARQVALGCLGNAPQDLQREPVAGALAASFAEHGDIEAVRAIADKAASGPERRRVLAVAATDLPAATELLWAELASLDEEGWLEAVADAAPSLSAAHCCDAVARAHCIRRPADADPALAALAARLGSLGAREEARRALMAVQNAVWRGLASLDFAIALARSGDAHGALDVAASVDVPAWQVRATAAALGLLEPASRTAVLDGLLAVAGQVQDAQSAGHLRCLVLPLTVGGMRQRLVEEITDLVANASDGPALSADLAVALARADDHDGALEVAARITDEYWLTRALAGIAPLLSDPDRAAKVREAARSLTDPAAQLAVLTGLTKALAGVAIAEHHGLWAQVLELLAGSTRREMESHARWLGTAVAALATDDGVRAAIVTCDDVMRWWP